MLIAVLVAPGQSALTLTPSGPNSPANERAMPITAAFPAQYAVSSGTPTRPKLRRS